MNDGTRSRNGMEQVFKIDEAKYVGISNETCTSTFTRRTTCCLQELWSGRRKRQRTIRNCTKPIRDHGITILIMAVIVRAPSGACSFARTHPAQFARSPHRVRLPPVPPTVDRRGRSRQI